MMLTESDTRPTCPPIAVQFRPQSTDSVFAVEVLENSLVCQHHRFCGGTDFFQGAFAGLTL
jgi:hypothetical protein